MMPPQEHIEHETVEAMKKAGLNPAFIYAYEQTGLIVTEENMHLVPNIELDAWQAAIEEYGSIQAGKGPPKYPIGIVATYGPDDKTVTKIVAGVFLHEFAEPIIERWVGTGIMEKAKILEEVQEFFTRHGVKSVTAVEGNMGCPDEEGEDFPVGLSVLPVLERQATEQRIVLIAVKLKRNWRPSDALLASFFPLKTNHTACRYIPDLDEPLENTNG